MIIARKLWLQSITVALILLTPIQSYAWPRHGKVVIGSAPVLSAATGNGDGPDFAQIGVTTNTGSGTLFWVISTNCSTPSAAQVIAGHDQGGGAPSPGNAGSQAVSVSGVQSLNPSGLTGVNTYCAFFAQTSSGNSNVAASTSFGTGGTLTITKQTTAAFDAAQSGSFGAVVDNLHAVLIACLSPAKNITVIAKYDYQASGSLAFTNPSPFPDSYSSVLRAALIALPGKNTVQSAIFTNPPVSDPTGLGDTYYMTNAQYRALGLTATPGNPDYQTTVSSSFSFDTTANGSCVSGNCLWTILLHESTEGLGRKSGIDSTGGPSGSLMELTSYSSAGVRNSTTTGARYPSIDAGTTNLISPFQYNQGGGNDLGDWTSASNDAFTATITSATAPISILDIKEMTKMGWGLTHSCRTTAGL